VINATPWERVDWPALSIGARHTLRRSWLDVAEGRLSGCEGLTMVDGGTTQVAMMGRVVAARTDNPFTDPYLPVSERVGSPERIFPAMALMYPNYDAYPVGPGARVPARLSQFVAGVCRHVSGRGLRSVVFQYLGPEADLLVESLRAAGFGVFTIAHRAELAVEFDGLGDYLSSFPKRRRDKLKHEIRALAEAGVTFTVRPLGDDEKELIDLRCLLTEKYRGTSDPGKERKWFDNIRRCFPERDVFVVAASTDGQPVGFTLFIRTGDRLSALLTGVDYHHPRARYVYFGTSFYAAVPLAADIAVRVIEYGMGSEEAKRSRGCALHPLRWAVRDLGGDGPIAPGDRDGSD
jgi:hypothetical protein